MATIDFERPHLVAALLDQGDLDKNIILMDIYGELEDETWLADITVIFNPFVFSRGSQPNRVDYYLGCTEATIKLDLVRNGEIEHFTDSVSLNTERKISKTLKNGITVSFKPELETEAKGAKLKFSVGELSSVAEKEYHTKNSFSVAEYPVQAMKLGHAVEWRVKLPKGSGVIRDFLYGNKVFNVKVKWAALPGRGKFTLRTSNIQFFDNDGEALSGMKSIAMRFLHRREIQIKNRDGLTFNFEINA